MATYTDTRFTSSRDLEVYVNSLDPSVTTIIFVYADGSEKHVITKPT
jgi:hypothetical protein